jgi:hypothetical protein
MPDFLPRPDAELLGWVRSFGDNIAVKYAGLGLTELDVTNYAADVDAFAAGFMLAIEPATRTRGNIAAKDAARRQVVAQTRTLVRILRANPAVTDAQLADLGLPPRPRRGASIGPPIIAPRLELLPSLGRIVHLRLWNDGPGPRRGKPHHVAGAMIFYCLADHPSADLAGWQFAASTSQTTFAFTPPLAATPGTQVWLTAIWFNAKGETSPMALPVRIHAQFGVQFEAMAMAA